MEVSLLYVLNHFRIRIADFFRHWYFNGFFRAVYWTLNFLERLDRVFALRVTFKNWFQPLYQDYSLIGYLWGFLFRTVRIFAAIAVYFTVIFLSSASFFLWAFLPLYAIYRIVIDL
ncbi:MAG: hypothetical protein A3I89_01515 [Candidatus Harrisonbacteria bacterium RIFCSPLOWO2_02_FULL_41_11]|uniref:Uncharacterized protein n=1 Tax=Candidatus Harrisonbacteria bacterium RIFCSPHIGHO2_02_FULL_42_16 TaxID=1798404 RepID=A0A1G1ZHC6_9BACT|nr:MAG: hypothetical protein A3B92_03975 [Candidatus Harrisonbacteria bacterium RIFCSPHIGHO2_02_FULL_42_16]OGY66734.1 MAG: hypothetical protein A3I89_01515 [Candidatus Harrisonbacteria bacterium RIFCSPLOWO2_02_FULL_41_11]